MALTGSYGINDVEFNLQPTSGRWMPQTPVGISGDGHPIYAKVRSFQMTWGLSNISDFDEIMDYYRTTAITGSVTIALPDLFANSYTFRNFSGCTLQEPEVGPYFTQHLTDATMFVLNIML